MFWHYTTGENFKAIMECGGVLVPAYKYVPLNERPVLWFSSEDWWEPTAAKGLIENGRRRWTTMQECHEKGGGLVRVGVEPKTAPHDWQAIKELSGMASRVAAGLYKIAIEQGSRPGRWRGTFDPVGRSLWRAVHVFDGERWTDVELPPLEADQIAEEAEIVAELKAALLQRGTKTPLASRQGA